MTDGRVCDMIVTYRPVCVEVRKCRPEESDMDGGWMGLAWSVVAWGEVGTEVWTSGKRAVGGQEFLLYVW